MSYPDSVRFLYALGNELKVGAKFGLDRIRSLMRELGSPELRGRVVHVAGTNGKGSTCAIIASAARAAGLHTGLYTSPHLVQPTERIRIDGRDVTEDEFAAAFEKVNAAVERLFASEEIDGHASYFETVTAMAFLLFAGRCDVEVIEVGLGGRFDATNVVQPELTVITPVSFDHEAFLGKTLESIAGEKAGILKPGIPLVLSRQSVPAESVITARAVELGCPILRTRDYPLGDVKREARSSSFCFAGARYECALAGEHQVENAATAILACQAIGIGEAAIQKGLREVRWPGRLEVVRERPDFILDGAHNPAGALALAAYIREFRARRTVWMIYGAMRDKAIDEVAALLFPLADRLILTAPDMPRALRPEAILAAHEHPNAAIAETLTRAVEIANGAPVDAFVFFTGSLYLVGEARRLLSGRT